MRRRWSSVLVVLVPVAVVAAACSDDGGSSVDTAALAGDGSTGSTPDGSATPVDLSSECEAGQWTSTAMTFPTQAGIAAITTTGGGDGMDISLGADGTFQIDFGPMSPATATFESGGQQGVMSASFSGVGKGIWTVGADGVAMASFENFATAKALVTLKLGDTVPPIFDNTLEDINADRMLDGQQVGVFTFTDCSEDALTMTTPFPGGTVEISAARA